MRFFWSSAVLAAGASVLSAMAADAWLTSRIALIGSFAGLQYSLNPGIAWGIRLPSGLQQILIGTAMVAVVIFAYHESRRRLAISDERFATRYPLPAYGLIAGGGIGNIIDRLRDGVVTDYFQVGTFPIFNVADSCITVGVGLLLCIYAWRSRVSHDQASGL